MRFAFYVIMVMLFWRSPNHSVEIGVFTLILVSPVLAVLLTMLCCYVWDKTYQEMCPLVFMLLLFVNVLYSPVTDIYYVQYNAVLSLIIYAGLMATYTLKKQQALWVSLITDMTATAKYGMIAGAIVFIIEFVFFQQLESTITILLANLAVASLACFIVLSAITICTKQKSNP